MTPLGATFIVLNDASPKYKRLMKGIQILLSRARRDNVLSFVKWSCFSQYGIEKMIESTLEIFIHKENYI